MKRMIAALLALALVVPQFAVAQPVKPGATKAALAELQPPRNVTAEATGTAQEVTVTVRWNSPSAYFDSSHEFEFKVNQSNTMTLPVTQATVNGASGGEATIPTSTVTTGTTNTIWIRVHSKATDADDVSDWVKTSVNVPPQDEPSMPATFTPNGGTLVKNRSATVQITAPDTVTVGFVPAGVANPPQEQAFDAGTHDFTFLVTGPGQIRARSIGSEQYAQTDLWSNIFEVVLPSLDLTVLGGNITVVRGRTATATIEAPAGKTIRVEYVVQGQPSQVETFTGGTLNYTFTANQTGQVRAVFAGDDDNAPTTVNSGTYTVVDNPLPLTVGGGGVTVSYGTTQTAVVTIPETVTPPVTVGYQVDGQGITQPKTFTSGTHVYSFKATGTGQVVATFAGNSDFNATTQRSGIYAVKPVISTPTVSKTKVGIFANITAEAIISPAQANGNVVGFRCYHLEKQSDGAYKYVLRQTVIPDATEAFGADSTRFSANFDLSKVGRWHIVAFYAGSDTLEATQGNSRTVTVEPVISKTNAPSSARRLRNFTVTASIMPRQGSNTYVRFRCYHREKQRNGTYKYVLRKTVTPKVTTINSLTSLLTGRFSLPLRGTWRIAAYYKGSPFVPAVQGVGDSIVIR